MFFYTISWQAAMAFTIIFVIFRGTCIGMTFLLNDPAMFYFNQKKS